MELQEKNAQWYLSAIENFRFYDRDHNGFLDHDEFAKLYTALIKAGYALNPLEHALKESSGHMDGHVTLPDFLTWLESQHS